MAKAKRAHYSLRPRIRIVRGSVIALGPGKADLLEALQSTGSITKAAIQLKMSYMRAWTLIRTMNRCFREPLVVSVRGGTPAGGGARLTAAGREIISMYRRMEAKSIKTIRPEWQKLQKLLKSRSRTKK
jgi:molybdate transport system regulatory protein